jgi:hypothetical protein
MKKRISFLKIVILVSLTLMLSGVVQVPQSAWASMEDAAIFYEELNQHGEWVEYGNYGPVWYPTRVQENWRPYVDGRWTPAEEGYVFETQEPWGWATYHYGNWMPTEDYGWVWVPGRTWYPNTVSWRTSAESVGPSESYIGWAPIPPPNYTPQPGYYPEGYYGGAPYGGPADNLITSPFWIFVKAASFLLGFSQPYSPSYSYWGSNALVPPTVVPYYYNRTVVVHNYYTPNYYPRGVLGGGRGYYNWGPPLPYVSRVTRIKQVTINNYVRRVNIYQRRNVAPPPGLLTRRHYFRNVVPPSMVEHRALPRGVRVRDRHAARGNLARPNLVRANMIKNAPHLPAHIPKTRMTRGGAGQWHHGVAGVALPSSAVMRSNKQMENHLRKIPPSQRIEPVSPRARKWRTPQGPGAPTSQPAAVQQRRGHQPTSGQAMAPGAPTPRTAPPGMRQGSQGPHKTATHRAPGAPQKMQGQRQRTSTPGGVTSKAYAPGQAGVPQGRGKPGKQQQPGTWTRKKSSPQPGVTRGQPPGQRQKARYTPGTPSAARATPGRMQPQRRPSTPQPQKQQKQQQKQRQQKKYNPEQSRGFGRGGPQTASIQPYQRQSQPQPSRQMRQPNRQAGPQIWQQNRSRSQTQVRQQPRSQPQRQVRQQKQARPQEQRQFRQQKQRSQPQRQVRKQPQARSQRQVRQQPRQQPRQQAQNRSPAKQHKRRNNRNKKEQQHN